MKLYMKACGLLVVASALARVTPLGAQQTIGAPYSGSGLLNPVGFQYSMGETFTTGNDFTDLNSFSFWLRAYPGLKTVDLFAYVMAWNPATDQASGPILFQSPSVVTPTNSDFQEFRFDIAGGLNLNANAMYVAFLSQDETKTDEGYAQISYEHGDPYTGGSAVFSLQPQDQWTSTQWTDYGTDWDASFQATLSAPVTATPEPASMTLVATGIFGVAGWSRRRKKSAAH